MVTSGIGMVTVVAVTEESSVGAAVAGMVVRTATMVDEGVLGVDDDGTDDATSPRFLAVISTPVTGSTIAIACRARVGGGARDGGPPCPGIVMSDSMDIDP